MYYIKPISELPDNFKQHVIDKLLPNSDFGFYTSFYYHSHDMLYHWIYCDNTIKIERFKTILKNMSYQTASTLRQMIQWSDYTAEFRRSGEIKCEKNRFGYSDN